MREANAVRRAIGYVPQESGVDRYGTGRENLMLQGRVQGMGGQELRARYETPQKVPPEMLRLLAHLDEQAGKESQALNEKQEPEHHAFHVDAAVEHES